MVIKDFDIIPDDINWQDTGCEFFPSCLSCPRDKCIEEDKGSRQHLRMVGRAKRMASMLTQGKTPVQIARIFQLSIRTVQRSLATVKKSKEPCEKSEHARGI